MCSYRHLVTEPQCEQHLAMWAVCPPPQVHSCQARARGVTGLAHPAGFASLLVQCSFNLYVKTEFLTS